MAHDEHAVCRCVAEHRPGVLEYERHHILPLSMGGAKDDANEVWLCPTAHTNTHELLREILRRGGVLTWGDALAFWDRPVSRYAFELAQEGYRRFAAMHRQALRSAPPSDPDLLCDYCGMPKVRCDTWPQRSGEPACCSQCDHGGAA